MLLNDTYRWEKCLIRPCRWNVFQIYHKWTWYKFVYDYDEKYNEYTLITFIIKSKLDIEVWKIMKNLWMVKRK